MNPFADQEARFAEAILALTKAAKAAPDGSAEVSDADPIDQSDLDSDLKAAEQRITTLEDELEAKTAELAEMTQRLADQASVIDDVDTVIDGLRAKLGEA
ncbi:MAG: hypothetical protein AAF826_12100 [Pseudomonadota bacterium]